MNRAEREQAIIDRDRARQVFGWAFRDHTPDEVAGIRHFLATGEEDRLPAGYETPKES